jgi:hypothetical protein
VFVEGECDERAAGLHGGRQKVVDVDHGEYIGAVPASGPVDNLVVDDVKLHRIAAEIQRVGGELSSQAKSLFGLLIGRHHYRISTMDTTGRLIDRAYQESFWRWMKNLEDAAETFSSVGTILGQTSSRFDEARERIEREAKELERRRRESDERRRRESEKQDQWEFDEVQRPKLDI